MMQYLEEDPLYFYLPAAFEAHTLDEINRVVFKEIFFLQLVSLETDTICLLSI